MERGATLRARSRGLGSAALIACLLLPPLPQAVTAQAGVPGDSVAASAPSDAGTPGHYLLQTLVGAVSGWGAGLALGAIGSQTTGEQGGEDPGLEGFIIWFPVGFLAGSSLGVGLTAKAQGEPHSYFGAALGALAGGGLVVALIPAFEHSALLYPLAFALPASAAVVSNRYFGARAQIKAGLTGDGQMGLGFSFNF